MLCTYFLSRNFFVKYGCTERRHYVEIQDYSVKRFILEMENNLPYY